MAVVIFWGALALCAYTYGGYLLTLVLIDAGRSLRSAAAYLSGSDDRRAHRVAELPRVSVLIAAHNEAACIRQKIENTLALDYPQDRLEILVGSDGSDDGTDAIVREYEARGVRLSAGCRAGKAAVLNRLARVAGGSLWLFTDANTVIEPGALRSLTARMVDADAGAVCGRLRLVPAGRAGAQEGLYWRYENLLKLYESRQGGLIGANGGLYLLRRAEWRPLPEDTIVDDFLIAMRVLMNGRKVLYAPDAIATEETAVDLTGEFARRVRISAGNFQSLRELWPLLKDRSFAGFAFWSHKMLRWCAPAFLLAMFAANAALAGRPVYALLVLLQLAFYGAALGSRTGLVGRLRGVATARYFVEMNMAIALGLMRWLRGTQAATWQRTSRAT